MRLDPVDRRVPARRLATGSGREPGVRGLPGPATHPGRLRASRLEAENPGTQIIVILPRRSFWPLLGRLMHDRTADSIAMLVSRLPTAAATITPLDVQNRIAALAERPPAGLHPGSSA